MHNDGLHFCQVSAYPKYSPKNFIITYNYFHETQIEHSKTKNAIKVDELPNDLIHVKK